MMADVVREITSVLRERIVRQADFSARTGPHDRAHVRTLTSDLRNRGTFKPVLVWSDRDSPEASLVLLDCGYRLDAYKSAGWQDAIPVEVVHCDRHTAHLLAAAANSKDAKPLSASEKSDLAWRLVRAVPRKGAAHEFSIREIAGATGVVPRTVSNMRKRWADMRQSGLDPLGVWRRDSRDTSEGWEGDREGMSEAARKAAVRERARALMKATDGPGARDDEFVGDVLAEAYGHRLRAIFDYLYGDVDEWTSIAIERDYDARDHADENPDF